MMASTQVFAFLVMLIIELAGGIYSSPVLVRCTDSTFSYNDTGSCWKEGASVVCNSLEHSLCEAERLNTSMLVENTSQCTARSKCSKTAIDKVMHKNICPPGLIPTRQRINEANQTLTCECLEGIRGIVKCANISGSEEAFIMGRHCMTYDETLRKYAVGDCIFSCKTNNFLLGHKTNFISLPYHSSNLEEIMCGKYNRQGFLCSECHPGYNPPAYSYSLECISCDLSRKQLALNWMGYLVFAILPQSILFLLMAIFRVGVTSPPFSSMVQVFQGITTPYYLQTVTGHLVCQSLARNNIRMMSVIHMLIIFYEIFNLDIFRSLSPTLCLKLDTIELLILDYASAFWPFVLIIFTYILVELHSRGFKPIVFVWKPVQYCLKYCRHDWHFRSSLIETFASFLLLSWIKLLAISYSLLTTTCIYTVDSSGNISMDCTHLQYSPNMKLFARQHILSGILSIIVLIVFILFPLLLLLFYPFRFFQQILNRCGFQFRALHVFMDSFQGSFRDGTDGSIDCRWFSSIYLIMRITLILLGTLMKNAFFFPMASIMLMIFVLAVSIIRPYKS